VIQNDVLDLFLNSSRRKKTINDEEINS
jgi:hypothetical protein